ncbi:putative RNA-binding protein [Sporomusaceae bacterium BoRhaA]|uniref:CooT family nickel-binding protein n=1 Tax=Pelorhabdus rhamnosifermentans TaxID=2772457 RepID=UPI001C060E1B|nr:CooT family nickel-binding protein [Pelorhabdus rhamnosifermentans]MBU2703119.1 putative RNA-binding protein [Pelorhabdus rhamnosifermentans]
MCDANAYLYENGEEELLMESVDKVVSKDSKVYLENIYGFQKMFEGRIKELLLMDHRIILENYPGKQGM